MSPPLVQAAPKEPIVREEILEDREDEQEVYLSAVEEDDVADATLNEPIESEDSEEEPIEFMSSWRAIASKEQLPGVKSAVLQEGSLSLYSIETWKREMITRLLPRRFKVVKLKAVCSYERCKQLDECPQDITTYSNVYAVLEVLKAWHKQWPKKSLSVRITLYLEEQKECDVSGTATATTVTQSQSAANRLSGQRTATQVQLAALPGVLQSEQLAGNLMPAIAD